MTSRLDRHLIPLAVLTILITACASPIPLTEISTSTQEISPTPNPPDHPDPTWTPTAASRPEPTRTAPVESTPPLHIEICSPLEGEPIAALGQPDLLKNPFNPPRPGYDDGHFGIDLAYWTDAAGKPMQGLPVQAVLGGSVAGVIANRQPYGYAVIVETPFDLLPPDMLVQLLLPVPNQDLQPGLGLSCPDYDFSFSVHMTSIYTLYAHLETPPLVEMGDSVACGQPLGAVGTTGRSVNPHLHLETRTGPAGMRFASMVHYDNSATQEEMRLYCLWRISGAFPAFDPLSLFTTALQER